MATNYLKEERDEQTSITGAEKDAMHIQGISIEDCFQIEEDLVRSKCTENLNCPDGNDQTTGLRRHEATISDSDKGSRIVRTMLRRMKKTFAEDHESFVMSTRIAISMTLASLFTLLYHPDHPYPDAQWIVTSAAIVAWQTQCDTASAVQKAFERIVGTAVGMIIGLAVGFLSLLGEHDFKIQASILGVSVTIISFAIPFVAIRLGFGGSYAARLSVITFGIVAMSFYTEPDDSASPVWSSGVYRAANIMIGCIVALLSLLLWPQSTRTLIIEKVNAQVLMAGDSAAEVLNLAYDSFVHKKYPIHWDSFLLLESEHDADSAYKAYMKGISSWKACKDLFPMLKYDPFFLSSSRDERVRFRDHMTLRSERAFRIQSNLLMLDSISRGGVNLDEYIDSFEGLQDIGHRIQVMLDLRNDIVDREDAARTLLDADLARVRAYAQQLRSDLSLQQQTQTGNVRGKGNQDDVSALLKRVRECITIFSPSNPRILQELESREQVALYYDLVEHLIIRATRLHFFCQEL